MSMWRAVRAVMAVAAIVPITTGVAAVAGGTTDETTRPSEVPHMRVQISADDPVIDFTGVNVGLIVPGDTRAGLVTVENAGPVPVYYYIDATASNDDGKGLGGAFMVRVTGGMDTATTGRSSRCLGETLPDQGRRFLGHLLATPARPRLLAPG